MLVETRSVKYTISLCILSFVSVHVSMYIYHFRNRQRQVRHRTLLTSAFIYRSNYISIRIYIISNIYIYIQCSYITATRRIYIYIYIHLETSQTYQRSMSRNCLKTTNPHTDQLPEATANSAKSCKKLSRADDESDSAVCEHSDSLITH